LVQKITLCHKHILQTCLSTDTETHKTHSFLTNMRTVCIITLSQHLLSVFLWYLCTLDTDRLCSWCWIKCLCSSL